MDYRIKLRRMADNNIDRLESWLNNYDIGSITASRKYLKDVHDPHATLIDKPLHGSEKERKYTRAENQERNKALRTILLSKHYGITKVTNFYPEGGEDRQEESFLVVNLSCDPTFKNTLRVLSEWYNQECFLYKPKGENRVVLIGTNDANNPGYGKESIAGGFMRDVKTEFMSRLRKGGFSFSDATTGPLDHENWKFYKDARLMTISDIPAYCIDDSIHSFLGGMAIISEVSRLQSQNLLPRMTNFSGESSDI